MKRLRSKLAAAALSLFLCVFAQALLALENEEPVRIIRSITIENNNIFDLNDSRESGAFYRATNSLHIQTKKEVIERQLLFKTGDVFSSKKILESERILRTNRYIADATIRSIVDGQFVDIIVSTKDTWSTKPKIGISQSGGDTKRELGVKEENLLGLGVGAELSYRSDADRTSYIIGVDNKHLFDSWYSLGTEYESNSDGYKKSIELEKPFYSLETQSSHGIKYLDEKRNQAYYLLGKKYFEYTVQETSGALVYGWSNGLENHSVLRHTVGIQYDEKIYSATENPYQPDSVANQFIVGNQLVPNNRKYVYPFYRLDYLEDRYQKVRNIDHIGKVEDRYMGFKSGLKLGYASTEFGSCKDALLLDAYLSKTFNITENSSLSLDSAIRLLWTELEEPSLISSFLAKYYQEQSSHFKFYSDFSYIKGHNMDLDNQLFLGNETGLRGFPAHYLSGDQVQKFTIEERYYSDAKPFRIFGIGAALFADVGRISGGNALEREQNGTYGNIGIGLRIANNRSSDGDIIHLDFAVPVGGNGPEKGFQINLQLKPTF